MTKEPRARQRHPAIDAALAEGLADIRAGRVSPSFNADRPFNGWSKSGLAFNRSCGIEHFQLYDLRRSVASGLQRCSVRLETIEKLLNHVSGSFAGIVSVYQRHDFLPETRDAIEKWEAHLTAKSTSVRPRRSYSR